MSLLSSVVRPPKPLVVSALVLVCVVADLESPVAAE